MVGVSIDDDFLIEILDLVVQVLSSSSNHDCDLVGNLIKQKDEENNSFSYDEEQVRLEYGKICQYMLSFLSGNNRFDKVNGDYDYDDDDDLNALNYSKKVVDAIHDRLDKYGEKIVEYSMLSQSRVGCFPKVHDVDWRLDYNVRTSVSGSIPTPIYYIRFRMKSELDQPIQFMCTYQQLQDLVGKLADAKQQAMQFIS